MQQQQQETVLQQSSLKASKINNSQSAQTHHYQTQKLQQQSQNLQINQTGGSHLSASNVNTNMSSLGKNESAASSNNSNANQFSLEAEEDFISNKLVQKLEQVQKEKLDIQRKVQQEEEHIQNYLHRKLQEINRERLEIEQQLEDEQNFLLSTLNKQLREVNQRKEALKKKLEREQKEKQELIDSIENEQKYLRNTLQKKLDQIQREKESLLREIESEESERIGNLQLIIERILSEKNEVEELLSHEVREKQVLVQTLENQKSNLTKELQMKIDEIKRHRIMIQRQLQHSKEGMMPNRDLHNIMKMTGISQQTMVTKQSQDKHLKQEMTLMNKQMLIDANNSSNNSTPRTHKTHNEMQAQMLSQLMLSEQERRNSIGPDSQKAQKLQNVTELNLDNLPKAVPVQAPVNEDQTKTLLQSDMEYYEQEQKRMLQKIMGLTTQLEDIKLESSKYKKMWDDVKNKMRKGDQQQRFYQEMMMMHIYKGGQIQGNPQSQASNMKRPIDPYKRNKNPKHQIQDSSAENSFNNDFLT
eukprot:403344881